MLIIVIKYDTAPFHFLSTGYTDSSLEYSVAQTPYTNNSASINKTYSDKKTNFSDSGRKLGCYLGSAVKLTGNIPNPSSYNKETCFWKGPWI
jgi:hypothetical protein